MSDHLPGEITVGGHIPRPRLDRLTVIRQVRDRAGHVLAYIAAQHDGTRAGIITAAKAVTDRMFMLFDDASNVNSVMLATDASGVPRWMISPNFRFITEIGARNTNAVLDSTVPVMNTESQTPI